MSLSTENLKYDPGPARDRDETRRLLYMALLVSRTDRYELAGTLVNALAHHQSAATRELSPAEIADRVVSCIEGEVEHEQWIRDQIARITAELGS